MSLFVPFFFLGLVVCAVGTRPLSSVFWLWRLLAFAVSYLLYCLMLGAIALVILMWIVNQYRSGSSPMESGWLIFFEAVIFTVASVCYGWGIWAISRNMVGAVDAH